MRHGGRIGAHMEDTFELKVIARIKCDYTEKFGIPRQSGLGDGPIGEIIFEEPYRDANALRGLEGYSHIWLLWGFSQNRSTGFRPMVKPPRLGGNTRMGVFATRSPYRPNPIGLSSVKLLSMEKRQGLGTVLIVSGADLMDGTPIYDIKPYLPFTDSHPEALSGFAGEQLGRALHVDFPDTLLQRIPADKRPSLLAALSQDPRPAYQQDPDMPYGLEFAGLDVRFHVRNDVLTVFDVVNAGDQRLK